MEKLYYQVPYVREFQAVVISCTEGKNGNYEIILDQTGFYPEGGGQPADTGTLETVKVLDVHEKQGTVIHDTDGPLEPGSVVTGRLDWEKRFSNMQQHSGEHILSGLIHKHYGYDNVGFHMGSEEVTVDFNGPLTMEQIEAVEREANQIIYENRPVLESYPTAEELHKLEYRSKKELFGQVRIIEIPGGDVCACCGTHVAAAGEIGIIKVTSMIHYKSGVRLSMLCGRRALLDYEKKQKQVTAISNLLSAKPDIIADAVERLKQDNAEKDFLIQKLYQQLFEAKTEGMNESDEKLLLFEEGLTPVLLRKLCTLLYERRRGSVVLVCSGTEGQYQYAVGSVKEDMRAVSRELNAALSGRGGGSSLMAQGTFMASRQEIESVWKEHEEVRTD